MKETFYMVRCLMNKREGSRPSIFSLKEEALAYISALERMDHDGVELEIHLYEVQEIPRNEASHQ